MHHIERMKRDRMQIYDDIDELEQGIGEDLWRKYLLTEARTGQQMA